MAQLQSTNVVGTLCVNGVAIGGGKDFKFACYTGSTTFTPSSDLVDGNGFIEVDLVGGGGGGGALAMHVCNDAICCIDIKSGPGAGGGFARELVTINSTDACTVTVGSGGTAGWVSGSFSVTNNSAAASCSVREGGGGDICPGGDGGNTVFGSTTAYGGCGGYSVGYVLNRPSGVTACRAVTSTVTEAGLYGAFKGTLGAGDCLRTTDYLTPLTTTTDCRGCIAGIGVEGVSWGKYCGTYPGCGPTAKNQAPFFCQQTPAGAFCLASGSENPFTQTYGNGGFNQAYCNCRCPICYNVYACENRSGSAGDDGIVVIRWQE